VSPGWRRAFNGGALLAGCFVLGARDARAETFAEILGTPLTRQIGTALAQSIGRGLPLVAASAGFTYRYDPSLGFVRETSITGQLFLERPETLPPGRWNLSLSYQRVETSTIEGKDLDSLSDTSVPIVDPRTGDAVTIPLFGVDLTTTEITSSLTYGITQDLEVNITVPVIYSDFKLRIVQGEPQGRPMTFAQHSTKLGVGDIFLRGKYRLLQDHLGDLALGLVLRLPAGNEDNFQEVGAVEVAPMLYAASGRLPIGDWVHVQGYLNAGLNFDTASFATSSSSRGGCVWRRSPKARPEASCSRTA